MASSTSGQVEVSLPPFVDELVNETTIPDNLWLI